MKKNVFMFFKKKKKKTEGSFKEIIKFRIPAKTRYNKQ